MSGAPPENEVRVMLNRSAVVEPTIYLIPECDTKDGVREVLEELCEEIFVEQLDSWFRDKMTWPTDRSYQMFCR
jgi:hypothetical protein